MNNSGFVRRLDGRSLSKLDQPASFRVLCITLVGLFALVLLLRPWQGNEEDYFQLAFRRVSPASFSEFHAIFDVYSGRLVWELLIGELVSMFGYEAAHLIARSVQIVAYGTAFAALFKTLKFSILDALAVIAIFIVAGEQIFGHEWLFRGVEAKTLAYAAVVGGLAAGLGGRWLIATVLLAAATWLHLLVGGFWMLALALLQYSRTRSIAQSLRLIGLFSLLVLPLVILIGVEQFGQDLPQTSPSVAEIYVERNIHHIGPFFGPWQNWRVWGWRSEIIFTVFLFAAFVTYYPRSRERAPVGLVALLLLYLLLALVVSYLDRNTLLLSKFYLFRPSSLTLLLVIAVVLSELRSVPSGNLFVLRRWVLVAFLSVFLTLKFIDNVEYLAPRQGPSFGPLIAAAEEFSAPGEIVLAAPRTEDNWGDEFMPRLLERPTLVSYKFVPVYPPDLLRWHDLIEKRRQLFNGNCSALSEYPVRLLYVPDENALKLIAGCGDVVWHGSAGYLVRMPN